MKLLILGGYGTFGGRLAQLLADEPRVTLVIAGRSLDKATLFCRNLQSAAPLTPLAFDRDGDLAAQLAAVKPDILVDASGPFQMYGAEPYRVVEACIAARVHYLDLADGSDFVNGISRYDGAAKQHHLFVLSGVSSFPVLTAAVVRKLAGELKAVHRITGGISPSPYAGIGLNVIRAIAAYSGQKVSLTRGGARTHGYALTETMRYTICPPGKLPLRNIRFSLVDVPDLQIIPKDWPQLDSIWIGAGPVPEILHRALNGLAWMVRCRIIPTLSPFAGLFYRAINVLRWGEHRGGMFVSVAGVNQQGQQVERSMHLLAEGDDGPLIPSMAIEGILRHRLGGKSPAIGARPATHDLEFSDYDALFARRTITTGFREITPVTATMLLYQQMLQEAWQRLPPPIRVLHSLQNSLYAEGTAKVERGKNPLGRMVAALIGFPPAGDNIPVRVDFTSVDGGGERWQRNFAGQKFTSVQTKGKGRYQHLLCERFGLLNFGIALVLADDQLHLIVRKWDICGFPLPMWLAPRSEAYEYTEDGKFCFHVRITHPLMGLVVRYHGHLTIR